MDEETPHMHLVFLPVVHTTDKKGNKIDKFACSEFWKGKDSYRELQNAFYNYIVFYNFNLLRGLPKEETNRQHFDIKEYKKITNFDVTKKLVESITVDIPNETNINDLKKIILNKNEKILNDIIKPKEETIKQLYKENKALHKELSRQTNIVDDAEKYQIERKNIIADNKALHDKVAYTKKSGFDDQYYKDLVIKYINNFGSITKKDLDDLLIDKLPSNLSID